MCASARRSWGNAKTLTNHQRDAPREARQQPRHVAGAQSDAAGGRREVVRRDMKKNRAAAPARARADIVVEHADDIVKMVGSPHLLVAQARGAAQGTIVEERRRVVAPNVASPREARRRAQFRQRDFSAPREKIKQREAARGRRAVALAFLRRHAGAPQRAAQHETPRDQPALMRPPGGEARDQEPREAARRTARSDGAAYDPHRTPPWFFFEQMSHVG